MVVVGAVPPDSPLGPSLAGEVLVVVGDLFPLIHGPQFGILWGTEESRDEVGETGYACAASLSSLSSLSWTSGGGGPGETGGGEGMSIISRSMSVRIRGGWQ